MSKGIIYVMTTIVPGLVKIGKTGAGNFEGRMYQLEHNGYSNVAGLKRYFAIEVDDYNEKEVLLDSIFSKSRVENTELFALDADLVVSLLSSFEGKQIYPNPTEKSKDEVFEEASGRRNIALIPDGTYYLKKKIKRWEGKTVKGEMTVKNGVFTVLKGSVCCPVIQNPEDTALFGTIARRAEVSIISDVLQDNVDFNSPSMAAQFLTFSAENGWMVWKNSSGKPIDIYRQG